MLKNNFTKFKETEQELIPEDWDILKFGDMAELRNEKYLPNPNTFLSYIGLEHIDQQSLSLNSIGESATVGSIKSVFKSGDILFGKLRPYFRKVYRPKFDGICSTDIWVLKAKDGIDQGYLYWFVANQDFVDMASSGSKGTKMPRADWGQVAISEWQIPPLPEQQKIAGVLGALDEKIELNRKMNKTLESLAQAVFKKWFIDDADPNWEMSTIGKELETSLGGTPSREKSEYWNGDIPWINSGKVNEDRIIEPSEYITEQGLKKSATKLLPKGTTVLAITGATLGQYSLLEIDSCFNQSVVGIKESPILKKEYVYFWISQTINDLLGSQTGGAQQHINKQVVDSHGILIPDNRVLENYYKIANPIFEQITDNYFQIQTLSQIRNSLLPRLMSGKLRVK